MSWRCVDIASLLLTLQSGSRPKGGVSTDRGDVPSLGGENVLATGGVTLDSVNLVSKGFYAKMTKGHLRDGNVLINKDGAQTGKVGLYRSPDGGPACINEHLFLLRGVPERVTQDYLYYTLLSDVGQSQIRAEISGSAQPGLKSGFAKKVTASVPVEIREQSKIAEVLATVDGAIEQTEALIAKQQRIKTGLMQDLLTRGIDEHGNLRSESTHKFKDSPLGRIPAEWDARALRELVNEPITYGIVQAGPHVDDGVPYIRTGDMAGDTIDPSQLLRTSWKIARSYKRSTVHASDIVFALRATVGKVLPITSELDGANLTQGTAKISPRDQTTYSGFLLWAMRTFPVQNAIRAEQKGTTFMEITLTNLRDIRVALPREMDEQRVIAAKLEGVECVRSKYVDEHIKLHRIKTGLMQDLLTGNRRVTALLKSSPEATAS